MSKEHTPGPWFVVGPHPSGDWTVQDKAGGGGQCIAQRYGDSSNANARLIAAAPELLSELQRMVEHFEAFAKDHSEEASSETWAALYCAKRAIAKAEAT